MLPIVFHDKKYMSIGSRIGGPTNEKFILSKEVRSLVFNLSLPSLSAELPPNHVLREILAAIAERSHH